MPCSAQAARKAASTTGPVTRRWAVRVQDHPGVVAGQARISVSPPGRPSGRVEPVVGEVGLPALVGQLGGEPEVGRARPLARLGGD